MKNLRSLRNIWLLILTLLFYANVLMIKVFLILVIIVLGIIVLLGGLLVVAYIFNGIKEDITHYRKGEGDRSKPKKAK